MTVETIYTLSDISALWQAVHKATLLFVKRDGEVLLIRKKRGLGAGKINGPGGKLEPGETALACAVREVQEELQITPHDPVDHGRLRFQFDDGYSIDVQVFIAHAYSGEPQETDEAIPLWFDRDSIPFDQMWADDRIWLPHVLAGKSVDGRFLFSGDKLLEHDVQYL